jgi:hypothetical protein
MSEKLDFPPGVTAEVVRDMTMNLRFWLSDQSLAPSRRKEAREYLAKLWPPHEERYQEWLKLRASDPRKQMYD